MKTGACPKNMVVELTPAQMMSPSMQRLQPADGSGAGGAGVLLMGQAGRAEVARGGGGGGSAALECGRRLLLAARGGDTATVRRLMALGAPFTTDWLGTTPLHLAAAAGHADTLAALLAAGVSRDSRTKVDRSALHLAAAHGHAPCVHALIAAGACVDARDLLRMTPLHWAVERGHFAAAQLLLASGADPHAESKFRKTPLGLARARAGAGAGGEGAEMLRLLEDHVRGREAQRSVDAIVEEEADAEGSAMGMGSSPDTPEARTTRTQQIDLTVPDPVHRLSKKKVEIHPTRSTIHLDNECESDSRVEVRLGAEAAEGEGEGAEEQAEEGGATAGAAAAALLRRHGITLLPCDAGAAGGTLLSALHSGRSIVLSDAGKLMLKESGNGGGGGSSPVVRAQAAGAGPVITIPARSRPRPRPRAAAPAPAPAAATAASVSVSAKSNEEQVKPMEVGGESEGKGESGAAAAAARGAGPSAAAKGGAGAGGGGAVRIIMNRHNFRKLITTATRASHNDNGLLTAEDLELESDEEGGGGGDGGEGGESVVTVPEQFVRSSSAQYLRSQLLCAHAALHHLAARLRRARAALKRLQGGGTR